MKNVNYKELKRYDLGKIQNTYSGYLAGDQIDASLFYSTPSLQFGDLAKSIESQVTPVALAGGTNLLMNAGNIASNVFGKGGITSKLFGSGASAATNAAIESANTVANTAGETAGNAAGAFGRGLSGIANGLGAIGGIYGLINSGIDLAGSIKAFDDPVITSSDILNSMGSSTQTKYGQPYTTYTGLDVQGIRNTMNAANDVAGTKLQMSGANTGMSLGATIGGALGPIGMAAGSILGGLFGWLGGLFGSKSAAYNRMKMQNRQIESATNATGNYNTNAEAEGASAGLRNMFSNTHYLANEGKDVHTNFGEPGRIKMVHTPRGIEPGIELGIAGGKESITDFDNETSSVIDEGKKGVDNISVGIPIDSDTSKADWDNNVFIAGNVTNPYTGNTIAEDAEPYARNVEKINKLNPMTNLGKKTKEINLRNQMEQLRWLSDVLSAVNQAESYFANCGKTPKYDDGKVVEDVIEDNNKKKFRWPNLSGLGEYAMTILPHIAQLGYLAADNTDYTTRSYNPYVASDYDKYINNMRSRRLDPSQAIKNIEKAALQNRYATTHLGGLSAGQIAALSSMSNLATASAKNNILADYAQKNIALANEADKLGMQANLTDAGRRQQGNTNWYEWLMRSGSTAYNLKQAKQKAKYDQLGSIGRDMLAMLQYNQARALQNKKIGLFDKALDSNVLSQLNDLLA